MQPVTQYAKSGDVHIAYQAFGDGPINLVLVPGFVSNVENYWDQPDFARFLTRLASYARVVTFDKRGTGGSDRVSELPGPRRAHGRSARGDGRGRHGAGRAARHLGRRAALHPVCGHLSDRCRALVLYGSFSRFSYWFPTEEALAASSAMSRKPGAPAAAFRNSRPRARTMPRSSAGGAATNDSGASPAAVTALMRMNSQIEIGGVLPAVRVPTLVIHRTGDQVVNVAGGRDVAAKIPGARLAEFPGKRSPLLCRRERRRHFRHDRGIPDGRARCGSGRSRAGNGAVHRYRGLD